jgi:hypothetical protein
MFMSVAPLGVAWRQRDGGQHNRLVDEYRAFGSVELIGADTPAYQYGVGSAAAVLARPPRLGLDRFGFGHRRFLPVLNVGVLPHKPLNLHKRLMTSLLQV